MLWQETGSNIDAGQQKHWQAKRVMGNCCSLNGPPNWEGVYYRRLWRVRHITWLNQCRSSWCSKSVVIDGEGFLSLGAGSSCAHRLYVYGVSLCPNGITQDLSQGISSNLTQTFTSTFHDKLIRFWCSKISVASNTFSRAIVQEFICLLWHNTLNTFSQIPVKSSLHILYVSR